VSIKPISIVQPQSAAANAVATLVGQGKFKLGNGDPEQMGFMPVPVKSKKQSLFLIIVGRHGSGKNTLAYSAIEEGPVAEIAIIERGTEGDEYMQQYTKKGILRKTFVVDAADPLSPDESGRIFREWQKIMYSLYGYKGTVVLNTIDEIYEIARVAINGRLDKTMRRDYGDVNRAMNDILYFFTRTDCPTNLVLISKGVDIWIKGENTGQMDYKGFPNARYMSDGMISLDKQTFVEDEKTKKLKVLPVAERFSGVITRAPAATIQEGTVLKGTELNFMELKRRMLGQ
jgi:hypothetical protein